MTEQEGLGAPPLGPARPLLGSGLAPLGPLSGGIPCQVSHHPLGIRLHPLSTCVVFTEQPGRHSFLPTPPLPPHPLPPRSGFSATPGASANGHGHLRALAVQRPPVSVTGNARPRPTTMPLTRWLPPFPEAGNRPAWPQKSHRRSHSGRRSRAGPPPRSLHVLFEERNTQSQSQGANPAITPESTRTGHVSLPRGRRRRAGGLWEDPGAEAPSGAGVPPWGPARPLGVWPGSEGRESPAGSDEMWTQNSPPSPGRLSAPESLLWAARAREPRS